MAIEIGGKHVTRFAALGIADKPMPSHEEAGQIVGILRDAWTLPDLPDGPTVYAYEKLLRAEEWAHEKGMAGREIANGNMIVSTTRRDGVSGDIVGTASLVIEDGHIELGRVAADSTVPGSGWPAVEDSLRVVREMDLPGAVVDIASNRTAMTASLKRAAEQTGFQRAAIYVSPAVYGNKDLATWGCFGEYALNPDYLQGQGGKLRLPIPSEAPEEIQILLRGIGLINDEVFQAEDTVGFSGDVLPSRKIVDEVGTPHGAIYAVDIYNSEELHHLLGEDEPYYISGILPLNHNNEVRWMIQFCKDTIPDTFRVRERVLRRGVSNMYTEDTRQAQVAQLVQSLYPEHNSKLFLPLNFGIKTLGSQKSG